MIILNTQHNFKRYIQILIKFILMNQFYYLKKNMNPIKVRSLVFS